MQSQSQDTAGFPHLPAHTLQHPHTTLPTLPGARPCPFYTILPSHTSTLDTQDSFLPPVRACGGHGSTPWTHLVFILVVFFSLRLLPVTFPCCEWYHCCAASFAHTPLGLPRSPHPALVTMGDQSGIRLVERDRSAWPFLLNRHLRWLVILFTSCTAFPALLRMRTRA